MNSPPRNALTLKEQLIDKEKLIERQKRLAEQRDFLKDKFKSVAERKTTAANNIQKRVGISHKNEDSIDEQSSTMVLNQKKTFKSDPLSSNESSDLSFNNSILTPVIKNQQKQRSVGNTTSTSRQQNMKSFLQSGNESTIPIKSKFNDIGMYARQENMKSQMAHGTTPPNSPTRYPKLDRNTSKRNKFESKQGKYKKVSRSKTKQKEDNKFFSAPIVDNYLKNARNDSFKLPNDEYKELMEMKSSVEDSQSRINKLLLENDFPKKKKCFYHTTPLLETREDDGPIINCHIDKKNLILVQRDAINVYCKKDKNAKEWVFKDSMKRLRFKDVLKEMIISCNIKKKETLALCQIHLTSDEFNRQSFIKMMQYCFLEESGKIMKEYNLGSFDCALENLRCCHIAKKQCCIAITGWNVARSRTVGWVFTHSEISDTMKCGALIPLKHKVESLHDISLSPYRNVLLAFGGTVFTIWNAKTGERLSCCSIETISPKNITCHFGCFATIQKGFLFILANTEDKLHMIATNLDTEVSKSLRKFRLPRGNKCMAIGVKDDKLVGLLDKSIVCWSLKNTLRIQQIRLEDGETPFLNRGKILIATQNKLIRILTIKSDSDYRDDMANKIRELMTSESVDNESIPIGATAKDI